MTLCRAVLVAAIGLQTACSAGITTPQARTLAEFEMQLETLRKRFDVPGMSAIVDAPAGTLWEHGFGYASVAQQLSVTPATLFHLASLTKPFAAVIALQLEQEGALDLNAAASRYGFQQSSTDTVRLWHLLSHTSESAPPGTRYSYNGNRFGMIANAFTQMTGKTFAQLFDTRIRRPLSLDNTIPNLRDAAAFASAGIDPAPYTARLAQGYNRGVAVAYESYFGPSAGMVSNPRDVARFSRALDDTRLLSAPSRARMWAPVRTPAGATLPYAIGWAVQQYRQETVVWHYGLWTGASALIVKVPARGLTFVVLGNSPGLSEPFGLGAGDVTTSPFAMLFLSSFIGGPLAPSVSK